MKEKLRKDNSPMSDGINNNTYDLLFKDYKNLKEEDKNSKENDRIFSILDYFTRKKTNKLIIMISKIQKFVYKDTYLDFDRISYDEENKEYVYKDKNNEIRFQMISDGFNKKKESKKFRDELTSNKRKGKCHSRSITFAFGADDWSVVTGYITLADTKVLHSFVECKNESNESIIMDWTLNLRIKKEDYVRLTKFEELNSIPGDKIEKEYNIITQNLDFGLKPIVLFWDEIVNDLKRNEQVIQKNEQTIVKKR